MRLYHSHVWGYRWPAVCLCSPPLGQLEPSISAPWAPSCPSVRVWPPQQQHETVSSGLSLLQGTLLNFDQHRHCFECILCLLPGFQDKLSKFRLTFSCCGTFYFLFFLNHAYLLMVLAFHSNLHLGSSFMMPLMAINWYIVDPTPHSTCSHRPFSLRRWKALKPIIVFLEGRLPPWTLWHTFKESGRNVFRPDSVALALGLPSPPSHTHMQLFFLEERVNMCESHCSLELFFLFIKKGIDGPDGGLQRATFKKIKKNLKKAWIPLPGHFLFISRELQGLHQRPKHHARTSQQVFTLPRLPHT